MTSIAAVQGLDHVIMIADKKATQGDNGGYYTFSMEKLAVVNGKWVIGFAGTSIGRDLCDRIEKEGFRFSGDLERDVYKYADRMKDVYQECNYKGPAFLMLSGVHNDMPQTYTWSLNWDSGRREVLYEGAKRQSANAAIGANQHGALYLLNAYNDKRLTLDQRILLGYFTVAEVAKHDPRVGGPVEIAVMQGDKAPQLYVGEDGFKKLEVFRCESVRISRLLSDSFLSFARR